MTEAAIPRPFGFIRDSNGEMRVFQHKPFTEVESICYSTAPVYSHAQMLEVWQASRKQAWADFGAAQCKSQAAVKPSVIDAALQPRAVTADEDRVLRRAIWDSCTLVAKGRLLSSDDTPTPTKGPTP